MINYSHNVPPNVYPARLGLLATTYLVIVNILIGVLKSTPTSGSLNQVQIWLLICLFFIHASGSVYIIILLQALFSRYGLCEIPNLAQRPMIDDISILLISLLFIVFAIAYFMIVL